MKESIYYNPQKLLSYNAQYSFAVSGRGIGKTFAFKEFLLNRFLKKGEKFVIVRRIPDEILNLNTFFKDLAETNEKYKDMVIELKGQKFMKEIYIDGEHAGYGIGLSTAYKTKSSSFSDVTTIFYDEFLIEETRNHRYIQDEPRQFKDLVNTVFRSRRPRCILAANTITVANPYFREFGIYPTYTKNGDLTEFVYGKINKFGKMVTEKDYVCEFPNMKLFKLMNKETFRLEDGTTYGAYLKGEGFLTDNSAFIKKKPKNATYLTTLVVEGVEIGVWQTDFSTKDGGVYFTKSVVESTEKMVISMKDHCENAYFISRSDKIASIKRIKAAFKSNTLFFQNQEMKRLGTIFLIKIT